MKSLFVSQLKEGDRLEDEPFLLQDVVTGTAKSGAPYLRAALIDRSGQINGVYWDVPEAVMRWARSGQVALVDGRVTSYRNAPQIVVSSLMLHESPNMVDFLRAGERPVAEMVAQLRGLIATIGPPWRALLEQLLLDEAFLPRFASAPAAKRMHHAYVGGLLEHSLSMARLAQLLTSHYPYVNKDLLLAGALLHDVGKVIEYDTRAGIQISDDGHLVGHVVRGVILIEQAATALPAFPAESLRELIHLVASHHGRMEWGAPTTPKTLEAILLHQLDLIDSRVQGYYDFLKDDAGSGSWSQRPSPMFGTYLRRPDNPEQK